EGWERAPLGSALILQRGFDLPIQAREEGDVPVYGSTGVIGYHKDAKVAGPGAVTGRSGTLGQVHYSKSAFWPLNTVLWVKEFRRTTALFAVFILRNMELAQYNGGVSVPTLDRNAVHRVQVLIPPMALIEAFDQVVTPVFAQLEKLDQQS